MRSLSHIPGSCGRLTHPERNRDVVPEKNWKLRDFVIYICMCVYSYIYIYTQPIQHRELFVHTLKQCFIYLMNFLFFSFFGNNLTMLLYSCRRKGM